MNAFIYGFQPLGYGRDVLEDEIEDYFEGSAEVTGGGAGESGWNLDFEVSRDLSEKETAAFESFLARQSVPVGTKLDYHFSDGTNRQSELTGIE